MAAMRDEQVDLVFKALAHPERRRILMLLKLGPGQSLFDICASSAVETGVPLARQTISQHLDALQQAGLVEVTWKGRVKAHSANLDPLRAALASAIKPLLA
jgi:DNA-binding transcriptional ArsR family regulator